MCKVQRHVARQCDTSRKQVELDGGSETVAGRRHGITQHHATSCDIAQWVGRAEQPEGIAEWRETQWCNQRMWQSGESLSLPHVIWLDSGGLQRTVVLLSPPHKKLFTS